MRAFFSSAGDFLLTKHVRCLKPKQGITFSLIVKTPPLKHDKSLKDSLLKALIADFQSRNLFHPLEKPQLETLIAYFRGLNKNASSALALDRSHWSCEFSILVDVIADFLLDRPLEVLRKSTYLYPWCQTSSALKEVVHSTEFLVRSDPTPRISPYTANGGANAVSFCVSYPRSGSTLLTNILDHLIPKSRYSVFWTDGRYLSRAARDSMTFGDAVVKDHLLCNDQLRNKIIYVARDFREVLRSQILFLFNSDSLSANERAAFSSLSRFLQYLKSDYKFGDWQSHVANALTVAETASNVRIVQYEKLADPNAISVISDCLQFLEHNAAPDAIDAARGASENVGTVLRSSNRAWRSASASQDTPPLVQAAQANSGLEWYRDLPEADQECVKSIVESAPSRALGYC